MNLRRLILAVTLLLGGIMSASSTAHAYSFYWSKVEVKSNSWQTCMNFANTTATYFNLSQVRRDNLAVTGSRNGADATLTCIGTAGRAMAVIMVVGESDQPVRQLRDDLVNYITKIQCIDSPC